MDKMLNLTCGNIKITTYTLPDGTKLQASNETSFNSGSSFIFNDNNNNEYCFYNFMENQEGFYVIPSKLLVLIKSKNKKGNKK